MAIPPTRRVPPRFVPTLTEVVRDTAGAWPQDAAPAVLPERAADVVAGEKQPAQASPAPHLEPLSTAALQQGSADSGEFSETHPLRSVAPLAHADAVRPILSKDFEELLVHRVMQRVDVSLDIRLRGAIATVVAEQTRSIVPRLREEIEAVVRHAVYEAVADELADDDASH